MTNFDALKPISDIKSQKKMKKKKSFLAKNIFF